MERGGGLQSLPSRISKLTGGKQLTVILVGFTAQYAIYVHENLYSFHPVGQAKYLEQPFRLLQEEFKRIIRDGMARGATIEQALLMAGLRLQREAQILTPVDTGNLKNSAFTRVEK